MQKIVEAAAQAVPDTDTVVWREPVDKNGMSHSRVFLTREVDGRVGLGIEVDGRAIVKDPSAWFGDADRAWT